MSLPTPGTVVADKYRLESLVAVGGMGAVFRARHVVMDAPVALKWLLPELVKSDEARERLLREARAVAKVRHPNVVQVYDVDTHGESPFIVMELLDGETFEQMLVRGDVPLRRMIEILLGAMAGLSAAHDHGLVHRDIKPENIFIARDRSHPEGYAKLIDFGISKVKGGALDLKLTQTGHAVGTPAYMSLEQLTRTEDVDARTDIYSFGAVLYRALTGVLPFDGETFAAVVLNIATGDPATPRQLRPELPPQLDAVVMKAMARRREDRFSSIDELRTALFSVIPLLGDGATPRLPVAAADTVRPALQDPFAVSEPIEAQTRARAPSSLRNYALTGALILATAGLFGWAVSGRRPPASNGHAQPTPPTQAGGVVSEPPTLPTELPAAPPPVPVTESLNPQETGTVSEPEEPLREGPPAPEESQGQRTGKRKRRTGASSGRARVARESAESAIERADPPVGERVQAEGEPPAKAETPASSRRSGGLARDEF